MQRHLVVSAAPLIHDIAAVLASNCSRDCHSDWGRRNGDGGRVGAFAAFGVRRKSLRCIAWDCSVIVVMAMAALAHQRRCEGWDGCGLGDHCRLDVCDGGDNA
jgi:hypothetical protein